ncbi:LpqB family beta-propeller domain-containing protein [Gryllotalpicola daejeonensis]|uniref:LpqB family beta-propeller domain-containing protein n=1 Tax=Gryllotalpicola daejeonensis TaxID=993087 RepID=A0ABP7ZN42_9MICO
MKLWRRGILVVIAALAASVLAACATIPRDGAVTRGGAVSAQDNPFGQVDYLPLGPGDGESKQQILNGFIQAAVSPEAGYQIARQFLSSSFRSQWNPDASVTVDRAAQRTVDDGGSSTQLKLEITPQAFIDQTGDYRAADSQAPVPLNYSFVKEHGQWRISQAPPGIVIDSDQFQNVFSPHPLYFYSPDYSFLVPDLRWFPSSRTTIATRIAKALLAGPSPWLQDAVVTAFPKGAQLASGSVVVAGGTAQVALNSVAAAADAPTLNRMGEQLTESLGTSASSVDLTIGGVGQDVSGATSAVQNPAVAANPLVLRSGKFGFLSGKSVVPLGGVADQLESLHPTAATVTADGGAAAALADGSVYAASDALSHPVRVDDRHGLVAPSIDSHRIVWSATTDASAPFAVSAGDGATATLKAAWPDARQLLSFAVSRDGTRLAALIGTTDGQSHLMVAGIVRDATGHPTRLGEPVDLGGLGLSSGISLTWSDELTVAVLGVSPQGGTAIVTQQLGGLLSDTTSGPAGAAVIAAGNPSSQLWVLTSNGSLETPAGNGWQTVSTGVQVLATQQGRG